MNREGVVHWCFAEFDEDGYPEKEIGKQGVTLDILNAGISVSGIGSVSAKDMGYDAKYDMAAEEIDEILGNAAAESYKTCVFCGGKDDIEYTRGWILPVCKRCSDADIRCRRDYQRAIFG